MRNLFYLFGKSGLGIKHVRAVLNEQGWMGGSPAGPPAAQEIGLHRVECLRHLRRADEVVRAAEVALRPVADGRPCDAEAVRAAVGRHLEELEILCLHPLLFHSNAMFSTVCELKGQLAHLHGLLGQNLPAAADYLNHTLAERFRRASHAIFGEVERLLKNG